MIQRQGLANGLIAMIFVTLLIPRVGTSRGSADQPAMHHIEISQLRFIPENLSVQPGDTITWVNRDIVPHSATAIDQSWDTGTISSGESRQIIVTENFQRRYFCPFHPSMQAQLENASK